MSLKFPYESCLCRKILTGRIRSRPLQDTPTPATVAEELGYVSCCKAPNPVRILVSRTLQDRLIRGGGGAFSGHRRPMWTTTQQSSFLVFWRLAEYKARYFAW